jgi:hypothetical protein
VRRLAALEHSQWEEGQPPTARKARDDGRDGSSHGAARKDSIAEVRRLAQAFVRL